MATNVRSPIDDLTFDVITVLQNKAKALAAYDKYLQDAEQDAELHELFLQMRTQDEAYVRVLKEALVRRLDDELGYDDDEDFDDDEEDFEDEDEEGDAGARAPLSSQVDTPALDDASHESRAASRRGESLRRG